jgi:hypothetical protein
MLRFATIALALMGLMAAAPPHHQPTPTAVAPTKAETVAREKLDTGKREAERTKNLSNSETRNKAWDAKTERTMGGMCRGC